MVAWGVAGFALDIRMLLLAIFGARATGIGRVSLLPRALFFGHCQVHPDCAAMAV